MDHQSFASKSPSRYGPGPLWKKRQKDYLIEATRQKIQEETLNVDLNSSFDSRFSSSHINTTEMNEDRDCKKICTKKDTYPNNFGQEIPISFWSQHALATRKNEQMNPMRLFSKNCSFTKLGK